MPTLCENNKIAYHEMRDLVRYAKENNLDLAEVKKKLNPAELKRFKTQQKIYLEKIRKLIEQGADLTAYEEVLKKLSARAYVSRLQELQYNLNTQINLLTGEQQVKMTDVLNKSYTEGYLKTVFEIHKTAREMNISKRQLITNGYFSKNSDKIKLVAKKIIESGVNKENIIYINLDKKGFKSIKKADELENIIDSLSNVKGNKYLFIDEIQNVENFEEVINAYREEDEYSIFITGSNSYLLSGELITKLTGRYIEFEMFPLTFEEYLGMKEFYKYEVNSNLLIELNNYIIEGGFPRTMFFDDLNDKRTYVKGIVEEIFKKDIKSRCVIRKKETFDLVMNYIINNFGCTTSINNILENLNKSGLGISKTTLLRYVKCLIDAKILYECDRFDMKSKRALLGEKKYYIADLSFSYISNPDSRINYGPVLENIIYTYARSKSYTVTVGRIGKLECDFILKDKELNYSYVQVAYTILESKKTEDREYNSLEMIRDNYPKYVVTTDYLLQKRNGIKHINLMEYLKTGSLF